MFLIQDHYCVFCKNGDVDATDEKSKFWTSKTCGHEMCGSCKGKVFPSSKRESVCAACGEHIFKSNIINKPLDQIRYDTEREVRSTISKEFNKTLNNFDGNVEQYNNYLEMVEELIYIKVYSRDAAAIAQVDEQIRKNRQMNATIIAENEAKRANVERQFKEAQRQHRLEISQNRNKLVKEEREMLRRKHKMKQEENEVLLGEASSKVLMNRNNQGGNVATGAEAPMKSKFLDYGKKQITHLPPPSDQPKRLDSGEDFTIGMSAKEVSKRRKVAGGFKRDLIRQRVIESLNDGLLFGI